MSDLCRNPVCSSIDKTHRNRTTVQKWRKEGKKERKKDISHEESKQAEENEWTED